MRSGQIELPEKLALGMTLEWSPEAAKSWAGYIELYGQGYGTRARQREEGRWHREMAARHPAACEHLLVSDAKEKLAASLATVLHRQKIEAWYKSQRRSARQALLLRLRANQGADATTGRNYRIWRRYQEGNVTFAMLGQEFGISGGRAGQIVIRQREIAPLRQKIWLEGRWNLGRPLDIDANREDYRGKWLHGEIGAD